MSYNERFTHTARTLAVSLAQTQAINAIIAFPRGVDGRRELESTLIANFDTNPFVAVTEHLNDDTLELAIHVIKQGRFPVILIDDTSGLMDESMRREIDRAMRNDRKGFIILRRQYAKTGLEELVEMTLIDQSVYG